MCIIQQQLENLDAYKDVCDQQEHACCPPWSLVNYITLLKKHKSCSEITVNNKNYKLIYKQKQVVYFY